MHVVIAPNAFKQCLPAHRVGEAIAEGCRSVSPGGNDDDSITIDIVALADGGDGTAAILSQYYDTIWQTVLARDPLGRMIDSGFSYNPDQSVAIIEIAKASGLALLRDSEKDPMKTSSHGVGDLVREAVRMGMKNITVSLGGSATNDAGAGMAYALGFRFFDDHGDEVVPVGGNLHHIRTCQYPSDPENREIHDQLRKANLIVAVDVDSPLVGHEGATTKFAPQKGAKPEDLPILELGLRSMLNMWKQDPNFDSGLDWSGPGTGTAGGLGAGLVAFCGAIMVSGFELVSRAVDLESRLARADLVFTAEGMVDATRGKVPISVAGLCRKLGKPCAAITGRMPLPSEAKALNTGGVSAGIFCISPGPNIILEQSIREAEFLIRQTSEQVARSFLAGRKSRPDPGQ